MIGLKLNNNRKSYFYNKIGVVILSRYSSKRLPDKALIQINGKEVLKYIIERLETIFSKSSLIIATSIDKSDDVIEKFSKREGIKCYRGSLDNVASRFYEAASREKWKYAIRICGDNIFVNTKTIASMLQALKKKDYTFLSNTKGRTFPTGMSIEIVKLDYYKNLLDRINKADKYKEHVALYFYEKDSPKNHYYFYNNAVPKAAGMQLALDTPDDLKKIQNIINQFSKPHWEYSLKEIFEICKKLK